MAGEIPQAPSDKAVDEENIYTEIHRMTWKRRTTGLLAGITMGVGFGLLIGAAVAFLPWGLAAMGVAGATVNGAAVAVPVLAEILSTAAIFAGVGGMLGLTIGADVGSSAGAVTAGLTRTEPPGKTQAAAHAPAPGLGEYVNPKVGIACTVLFAGFGALLALNPFTAMALMGVPALSALSGTAATVASASIMGMFGATMGINFPLISAKLSNFYNKLVTGKIFESSEEGASPVLSQSVAPALAQSAPSQDISQQVGLASASSMVFQPQIHVQPVRNLKDSLKDLAREVADNNQAIRHEIQITVHTPQPSVPPGEPAPQAEKPAETAKQEPAEKQTLVQEVKEIVREVTPHEAPREEVAAEKKSAEQKPAETASVEPAPIPQPVHHATLKQEFATLVKDAALNGQHLQAGTPVPVPTLAPEPAVTTVEVPAAPKLKDHLKNLAGDVAVNGYKIHTDHVQPLAAAPASEACDPTCFSPKDIIAEREARADQKRDMAKPFSAPMPAPQAIIAAHESGAETAADPTLGRC